MNCHSAAEPSGLHPFRAIRSLFLLGSLSFSMCCSRHDAPPLPDGSLYPEQILSEAERRDESAAKIARLTQWVRAQGHEGVLISTPANFAWVTAGGDSRVRALPSGERSARLFFARDGRKFLIAPAGEASRIAREELAGIQYEVHEVPPCEFANGEQAIAQLVDGEPFVADTPNGPHSAALAAMRVPLTGSEIRKYRWLGQRCAEVVDRVCRQIQPGMTEMGIQALLSGGLMRHAIIPVDIHVAADARATKYGAVPASEKTKVEKTAVAGFSASRWGLVVAVARQVHFGPLSKDTRRAAEAVSAVTAGFWARTLPGTQAASVLAAAIADYERLGFPLAWTGTLQGGAVGYGRDWFACAGSKEVIQSGQAFAWSAFVSPVASEDTILVVGDQLEVLTEIRGWPVAESTALGRVYRTPAILVR